MVELIPVNSSNVSHVGYDDGALYVMYKGGSIVYKYTLKPSVKSTTGKTSSTIMANVEGIYNKLLEVSASVGTDKELSVGSFLHVFVKCNHNLITERISSLEGFIVNVKK